MKPIETTAQAKLYAKYFPVRIHSLQTPQCPDPLRINDYIKAMKLLEDSNVPVPDYLQKTLIDETNKYIESSNFHPKKACPCNICLAEKQISTPIEALSSMAYYMEMLLDLLDVYYKKNDYSHSMLRQEAKLMLKEITEKFLAEQDPPGE